MAGNRPPRKDEDDNCTSEDQGWSGGPKKRLATRPEAESRREGDYHQNPDEKDDYQP